LCLKTNILKPDRFTEHNSECLRRSTLVAVSARRSACSERSPDIFRPSTAAATAAAGSAPVLRTSTPRQVERKRKLCRSCCRRRSCCRCLTRFRRLSRRTALHAYQVILTQSNNVIASKVTLREINWFTCVDAKILSCAFVTHGRCSAVATLF